MSFTFRDAKTIEGNLPLLIGLVGPSGGGKTYSALRLATGIQRIRGGNIVGIDTESKRMVHYRDKFSFLHCEFTAPFSSSRYLEVITAAAEQSKGGVVIIDSMSHEHEGEGGYIEYHEAELDKLAGDDWKKREKVKFLAWVKPAGARRRLINRLLQLDCAFIFCFRAKEKIKPISGGEPLLLGWQPIAGEEFSFEMVVRCLLLPGANGVPDWTADSFKHLTAKLEDSHKAFFPAGKQIDETTGELLAKWAKGASTDTEVDYQNYLDDIKICANMEELQYKFSSAQKLFKTDKEIISKLIEAKDTRKMELAQQTGGV